MVRALVLNSVPEKQRDYADFLAKLGFRVDVGASYAEARVLLEKWQYALLMLEPYLTYPYDGEDLLDWADGREVSFAVIVIDDLLESALLRRMVAFRKRPVLTMKAQDFEVRKVEIAALVCRLGLSHGACKAPPRPYHPVPCFLDILKVLFAIVCFVIVTLGFGWAIEHITGSRFLAVLMSSLCALLVVVGVCALFGKQVREAVEILKAIWPKSTPGTEDV